MYYVYRVDLLNYVYVGCTNNIRRRCDQHNENRRKSKSRFGCFLDAMDIVLQPDDMKIIFQSENRAEALKFEKTATISAEAEGHPMLNDVYTKLCSHKGKNYGHTEKRYIVVDIVEHKVEEIIDLRQYGIKIGIDYRSLFATTKGDHLCRNRYKVFQCDEWQKVYDKDLYISGRIMQVIQDRVREQKIKNYSKHYKVRFPDGSIHKVHNLDQFAKDHNINGGNLHASYKSGHNAGGYRVIERL